MDREEYKSSFQVSKRNESIPKNLSVENSLSSIATSEFSNSFTTELADRKRTEKIVVQEKCKDKILKEDTQCNG